MCVFHDDFATIGRDTKGTTEVQQCLCTVGWKRSPELKLAKGSSSLREREHQAIASLATAYVDGELACLASGQLIVLPYISTQELKGNWLPEH